MATNKKTPLHNETLFTAEEWSRITPGELWYQDPKREQPVTVLGHTFKNDEERRQWFREELRKMLPELKQMEGYPIGEDDDIINLSDPPYYTACPNPWLNDFIAEWEKEKKQLEAEGKRDALSEVTEPFSYPIKEKKNNKIYVAHSYHTKVPPEVIINNYLYYTEPGDIVIDNFAGTGMAGVATNMCGDPSSDIKNMFDSRWEGHYNKKPKWGFRNCILGDLSPITSFITYNYCNNISSTDFNKAASDIYGELEKELGYLYEFEDPFYGKCKVYYYVWSEHQVCPNCGNSFLYWDAAIDISKNEQKDTYPCPICGYDINKRASRKEMVTSYDPILKKPTSVVNQTPVFVSFVDGKGHRHERELTKKEREEYKIIKYSSVPNVPIAKLEDGDKTSDPHRIGVYFLHQFYSQRNLIILSRFRELIESYHCDDRLKNFLRVWFTSCQSRLHMMNRYAVKHHRHVGPLSNTLYISANPTEISPFYFIKSKIKGNTFDIRNKGNVVNQIASATNASLKDNCIDYIFTDPPFGSNIMYSELNFIWESWLGIRTNNKEEAIVNNTQHKGLNDYQEIMLRCFKEYYRVLKPGKWITVEFSNTSAAVWNSIQLALQQSGFVVAAVTDLNKGRAGLHGIIGVVAVNQDLAISCYKPSDEFTKKIEESADKRQNVWDFIGEHLQHLPVHIERGNATTTVIERSPKILYDRLISYYVQHGYSIPMDAQQFQQGLKERFLELDGMFFTAKQAAEYEEKKKHTTGVAPMGIIVSDEANGIEWLKHELKESKTYQEISPEWMAAINGQKKGDVIPELKTILEENFIEDEQGKWHVPDLEKAIDLEKLHHKSLMREFNLYKEQAQKPRARIREVRVEALREGFKECFKDKDFQTILLIADKIPQNILTEDEQLLQYYDIASMRE